MKRNRPVAAVAAMILGTVAALSFGGAALAASPDVVAGSSSPMPTAPLDQLHVGTANPGLSSNVCRQADIGFAVDLSGSIAEEGNFGAEKSAVKSFVDAFDGAGGDGLFAGTSFKLASATAFTSGFVAGGTFKTAVDGLPSPSGHTPTAAGIATAATNTANDRSAAPNVLFVVTDGAPDRPPLNGDLNDPATWLQGANAAIDAANAARSAGWIVEVVDVGALDPNLPFGPAGDAAWVQNVMSNIGGGSFVHLSNFNSLVGGLLVSVGCPTSAPTATPPTATPFESFLGETATPAAPSETPFESFQGETATPRQISTPPPTDTTGDGSNGGGFSLVWLFLCAAWGAIGLLAVGVQKRSLRQR